MFWGAAKDTLKIIDHIFYKDWGVTGFYNAMVLSVEETDDSGADVLKVQIFKFKHGVHL